MTAWIYLSVLSIEGAHPSLGILDLEDIGFWGYVYCRHGFPAVAVSKILLFESNEFADRNNLGMGWLYDDKLYTRYL